MLFRSPINNSSDSSSNLSQTPQYYTPQNQIQSPSGIYSYNTTTKNITNNSNTNTHPRNNLNNKPSPNRMANALQFIKETYNYLNNDTKSL